MSVDAYKYTSTKFALATLRDLELKVTPPNEFNDPFEFSPHVTCSAPEREAKRILRSKRDIKEMYEQDKRIGDFAGNFREYRERLWSTLLPSDSTRGRRVDLRRHTLFC